jgi:hypothetical protein
MQSNAKHKFECYIGRGARNHENNMGLMKNLEIWPKKEARSIWNWTKNNDDLKRIKIIIVSTQSWKIIVEKIIEFEADK